MSLPSEQFSVAASETREGGAVLLLISLDRDHGVLVLRGTANGDGLSDFF